MNKLCAFPVPNLRLAGWPSYSSRPLSLPVLHDWRAALRVGYGAVGVVDVNGDVEGGVHWGAIQ